MRVIAQIAAMFFVAATAIAGEQDIFPKGTVMLSQVVTVAPFKKMEQRDITIPVRPHDESIVPVAVCIEDEKAKLFSPVAIKSIDRKSWTATITTSHGGKYAVVYVANLFPQK